MRLTFMLLACAGSGLCLFGSLAMADSPTVDPDTEVARRYFHEGAHLYEAYRYREAVDWFEKARAIRRSPSLDFNIARCWERLGEWDKAADNYERFLQSHPPEAAELRVRIAELRARVPPPVVEKVPPPPQTTRRSRVWLAWTLGAAGAALVALGVGLGVGLTQGLTPPATTLGNHVLHF